MFLGIALIYWVAIAGGTGFLAFLGINSWRARKDKKNDTRFK